MNEFEDRYTSLGIKVPDPELVCTGCCEGIGFVPVFKNDKDPALKELWDKAETKNISDDGYHFVVCPKCNGTGLKDGT